MQSPLVVTFAGPDRPGIVDALAARIRVHGGNWEESRLVRLAGWFTGLLLVRVPAARAEELERALKAVSPDVMVIVARGDAGAREVIEAELRVTCADRPGVVHEVSRAVLAIGGNIEELQSAVQSAPMSGEPTFHAEVRVSLGSRDDLPRLVSNLEALAPDLLVEVR